MRVALVLLIAACQPKAAPLEPIASHVSPAPALRVWARDHIDPFAVIGESLWTWDEVRDGVVERSLQTGKETRFRKIEHGSINGIPGLWEPVTGGYIASWDERLVYVRDHGGALREGWMVGENHWYVAVGGGDVVWTAKSRHEAAILAQNVSDGSVRWRAKLPDDIQALELAGDATTLVTTHQEYQAMPPGPNDIHRVFAAYESATGVQRWRFELPFEPRKVAVGVGGAAYATETELVFIDGASGRRTTARLPRPTYPQLAIAHGVVYVADDDDKSLSAYAIRDGHRLWRTARELAPGPELTVHGELVVGETHGVVFALDRHTGATRWEVNVAYRAGHLVVTDTAVVGWNTHDGFGFALPASQPTLETATIHGTVRAVACGKLDQLYVQIGDRSTRTDAMGRFSLVVKAVGRLQVSVAAGRTDPPIVSSVVLELTGKGDYQTPDLEASECPGE